MNMSFLETTINPEINVSETAEMQCYRLVFKGKKNIPCIYLTQVWQMSSIDFYWTIWFFWWTTVNFYRMWICCWTTSWEIKSWKENPL